MESDWINHNKNRSRMTIFQIRLGQNGNKKEPLRASLVIQWL